MKHRIYYTKPSITELEVQYATDAARNGWGDRCYEYINRFEGMFREFTGVTYSIAMSSCTGAIHMGLAALGVGPGDEVILPWNLRDEVMEQLAYICEWGGQFVTAVPSLKVGEEIHS